MSVLESAYRAAKSGNGRIVFPERDEPRIRDAADRLQAKGLAEPVWLDDHVVTDAHVAALLATRPGLKPALARRMLEKPMFHAAAMVAVGEADAMVAGAATPTRRVIEAALLAVGLGQSITAPSSFFLMVFPDGRELIFADCAATVAPSVDDLTAIALASAQSAEALLCRADVAMLSFSTLASGAGVGVDMVRAATEAVRAAGINVVGPVQADAALNPRIAARKGLASDAPANVLIFPSLDAGNIAYKLAQELAGARAIGPFLQGFARPICDLSRGVGVDEIVDAAAVTLMLGT